MKKLALGALLLFLAASFLPIGWNKFDIVGQASLLYIIGILSAIFTLILIQQKTSLHKIGLLVIFFAFLTTSFFTSQIQNYGWSEVLVWGFAIVLFVVAQTFSEKERKILKIGLVTFTLISCAVAVIVYLTHSENRMAGLFFDVADVRHIWPNAFALLLLMTWPIAAELTSEKKWWLRILILAPIFTCLFLTFSRAAMIAFAIQLIIIFFLSRSYQLKAKSYKLLKYLAVILTTIILIMSLQYARNLHFNTNSFQKKIAFEGTEKQTSFQERLDFFKGGTTLALQRPFFGYGPGTFRFIYPKVQTDFLANSDHPHNIFIKIAVENGIPAALALMAFFIIFMWEFWKKRKTEDTQKKLFIFAAVLGAIAHNLVDYNLNFLNNIVIFWLLVSLAMPEEMPPKSYKLKAKSHKLLTVLALLLTLSTTAEATLSLAFRITKNPEIMKYAQFPRDFWATKGDEKSLQYHLSLNPLDAYAWNNLGKIQQKNGDPKSAFESYKNAVLTNPANNFEFYVNYFRVAPLTPQLANTRSDKQKITETAMKFLEAYPEKVARNVHYTADSGNFQQAVTLAQLLHQNTLAEKIHSAKKTSKSQKS